MNLRTGFLGIGRRLDLFLYADFVPQAGAHVRFTGASQVQGETF